MAPGPRPEPVGGLAGDRVRRGDERIGAVVDVEQRALRALEQDALAGRGARRRAASRPRPCRAAPAARPPAARRRSPRGRSRPGRGRGAARCDARAAGRSCRQRREVGEVHHADGAAADLVLVGRADAAPGGADLRAGVGRSRAARRVRGAADRISGAFSAMLRLSRRDRDALRRAASRSPRRARAGSSTTPLPMTDSLPGRTTPEGSSDSL